MTAPVNQREQAKALELSSKEKRQKFEEFFEGTSGKVVGSAIVLGSIALGMLISSVSVGAAAPVGGTIMLGGAVIGGSIAKSAGRKAKTRDKWEKRLLERKGEWKNDLEEFLYEGASGILVGTGLAAAGAVAIATGALPLAGVVVAGGAIAIGAHWAASAPGKAKERQKWEKKILG